MGEKTIDRATDWKVLTVSAGAGASPRAPSHVVAVRLDTRVERVDGAISCATIDVHAWRVPGLRGVNGVDDLVAHWGGRFDAKPTSRYKLTNGSVLIKIEALKGLGIGTFLQNLIVRWAKEDVGLPGTIDTITLSPDDARSTDERDRRNQFYAQFGIEFDWSTLPGRLPESSGTSRSDLTQADLRPVPGTGAGSSRTVSASVLEALRTLRVAACEAESAQRNAVGQLERFQRLVRDRSWFARLRDLLPRR